jgi:hypothetical protein
VEPHNTQRGINDGTPPTANPKLSRKLREAGNLSGSLGDQQIGVCCQLRDRWNWEDPQATVRCILKFVQQGDEQVR